MNHPEYIVVHHSLTTDGIGESWEAIRRYHMEVNGWNDIGYHKGIELVGTEIVVHQGRPDNVAGAHAKEAGMNNKSIGICVVGNYDIIPPDDAHLEVLKQVCQAYMVNYNIPVEKVVGHREVGLMAGYDWRKGQFKTCPGSKFDMDMFRKMIS
jgi:N-acetylmuramoyl-L-alanine amidase